MSSKANKQSANKELAQHFTTFASIRTPRVIVVIGWMLGLLVIGGAAATGSNEAEIRRVLAVLLEELPTGQAASICAKLTGVKRREAYDIAMEIKQSDN